MSTSALQLYGCLNRIRIEKVRNCRVTCCECCSHLIIILILVFGYGLSVIENFSAEKYSELVLRVPPQTTGDQPVALRLYKNITRGPLIIPTFDQYIAINELLSDNVNALGASGDLLSQTDFGRAFTNLLYKGSLHFAPRGDDVTSFVEYMNSTFTSFQTIDHYIHDTEEEAVDFILNSESDVPALALIVLRQITPEKVNYVIRQNYTTLPNTNQVIEEAVIGLNEAYQDYFFSGFLTLQSAVDNWAFNYTNAISGPNNPTAPASCTGAPQATFVPYPTPEYNQNPFYNQVGFLLGLAIVMSTMYPMSRLTKSVVEEKELKLREVMKIMGLQEWVHQLSWFLSAFLLFFWIAISCTVITKATFLVHTDASILFAYFFLFCMSEINFAFFVSVFFSNSKLAAIVAPVVLFAGLMPRYAFLNTNNNEQVAGKTLACLLSPTAFAFGADIIAQYEYGGVGVQYSNASDGDFNFNTILLMMWADFFIYGFLAWYLDQVIPHEYGTAQPLWFFLNWRYWCPRGRPRDTSSIVQNEALEDMPEFFDPADSTALADGSNGDQESNRHTIEPIPVDQRSLAQVRIKNLRKRYPDGNLAVRDFSLSMLEGQITCLLGHNGAGKTTTISTLTGMIEATSGDASIYGCSLQYDLPAIRQLTGVCPQHNVLYPCLTVLEHLYFFGNVKGMYGAKLRTSVESVIEEVGLTEKRNALSQALSGGMKRKLSLAIALIGDPKFLLLDEPTSGMDPYSRRSTWELLQKSKVGRVVLLTTHFMEEADTLADRIAIMSEGNVRCSGSSLFLKTRFGVGYLLSISKARADVPVGPIEHLVKDVVPEAKVTSSIAGEVILQMPMDTVPLFASLFCKLRDAPASLGVGSYGISLTTLEQVFISLAKEAKEEHEDRDDHAGDWHYWVKHYVVFLASEVYGVLCCRSGGYQVGSTSAAESAEVESVEVGDVEMIPTQSQHPGDRDVALSLESVYGNKDKDILSDNALTAHPVPSLVVPATATGVSSSPRLDASPAHAHSGSKAVLTEEGIRSQKDTYNSHGFSRGTVPIQFIELYRKRLIIASRDIKGLFFQVIFPALQIVLIMLILTVSYNPAGHTITLHANMFDKEAQTTPIVQVAGAAQDNLYRQSLASVNMDLEPSPLLNSTSLSDFLLDPVAFVDDRYGAFLFGDSIPLHLTVDWVWVKENANNLNDTIAAIPGAEDAINSLLADVAPDLNIEFNQTLPLVALNITSLSDADIDALTESLFNISISSLFNISINSLFNLTAIDLSQSAVGSISADGVIYDALTNSFELQNVTLTLNNVTTELGSVTVPASEFAQFLPDTVEGYDIPVPSQYTIMHNSTSPHGAAAFYGELIETVFQQCSPVASQQKTQYLIKNHPLPITISQGLEIQVILALLTSLFIIVPLCYIPASFVSFLVKERVSKSKHLQIVSSVSPYLYWTATYCWDITLFLVLIGFILGAFFCFGSAAEVFIHSGESTLALFCLLVTYGLSSVALSYIYSMAFDNFSTAQISIMVINFVTGFVMVLAYYILISVPNTEAVGRQLVHLFRFFPPYNIGEGLINLSSTYYRNSVNGESVGYFDWPVTGRNIVFMLVEAVGYFGIVLLTEFTPLLRFIHYVERKRVSLIAPPAPPKNGYDEDVLEEAERVKHIPVVDLARQQNKMQAQQAHQGRFQAVSTLIDGDIAGHDNQTQNQVGSAADEESTDPQCALLIRELVKTYPPSLLGGQPKHAVRGVSLACNDGERFGLLGINGAGKTTTLGILTGDLQPTSGEVYIGGKPLSDPATMSMIGYCPQVDPLLDLMNGYETLWFFGRIRGIPKEVLEKRVNDLILQVGLERFAHKPCGTYSGGNKRKLSLAVALIGDPRVLFLDEPSTGMDPEARRNMWTVIEQVSAERCVVLVTHSMEEVEALCTRMGVMVSGRMQCIGSAQHLKSRFGLGYQVEIRTLPARVQDCIALCEAQMLAAVVEEVHGGYVRLKVSKGLDLAAAFSALEHNKAALQILDYNISQCTLEQVFLKFAKDQEEETGHVGGVNIQGAMESAEVGTREGNQGSARSHSSAPFSTLQVEVADPVVAVGDASPVVIVPSARRSPVNFDNDPGAEEKQ